MLADLERDKSFYAEGRREKGRLLHERIHNGSVAPIPLGSFEQTLEEVFSREDVRRELLDLSATLFPIPRSESIQNNADDMLHLMVHIVWKRDIFVTSDNDFLKPRDKIRDRWGAIICTPEEALQRVREHISSASSP